ncbi:CPC_1213 family protein [Oscillospiraceae bacterium MB08-C2-2]|nr:CPC_1213 family protein [Oscillospiraceae bacterium MB08-C2-2]
MGNENKAKSTKNKKKTDGKFHSKNIKHDPAAESARAVFGLNPTHSAENNHQHHTGTEA